MTLLSNSRKPKNKPNKTETTEKKKLTGTEPLNSIRKKPKSKMTSKVNSSNSKAKKVENEVKKEYRTYQIEIKKGHKLYRYFDQICLNSNNLYNTTNFYIRQVYTALNQDKNWQPLQKEGMDHIQNHLQKMNDNQTKSYHKRLEKENLKPMDQKKETKRLKNKN